MGSLLPSVGHFEWGKGEGMELGTGQVLGIFQMLPRRSLALLSLNLTCHTPAAFGILTWPAAFHLALVE